MFQQIYAMNLWAVGGLLFLLLMIWTAVCMNFDERKRNVVNAFLSFAAAFIILYATVLTRAPGDYDIILTPFAAFTAAHRQPELYREMLMNVFLFFPLGLTLSNALPSKWRCRRRIALTTLIGFVLSASIEFTQYRFSLGLAETDDVICNTLGAFVGSTSLLLAHAIEKIKERARHTNMTLTTTETQFLHIVKNSVSGADLIVYDYNRYVTVSKKE